MVEMRSAAYAGLRRHRTEELEVDFAKVVRSRGILTDDDLAELIELDGRSRLDTGKPVRLSRYLEAVPNLEARIVALDAAIDMALRSLSGGSAPDAKAIEVLSREYPRLDGAIREAAALGEVLCSTSVLVDWLHHQHTLALPAEIGTLTPDGRRRYVLTRRLGRGSQGQVYLATDRLLSEPGSMAQVAIKILGRMVEGSGGRDRQLEEATKARRVSHPNVVRVLDRGVTDDGSDYIVYEYVEGGDLAAFVVRHGLPLPVKLAVRLVAQIARGVQSAHSAGLVHCDLKPGNIVMDGVVPKVADFGVAVRLGARAEREQQCSEGMGLGNIAFVSPEQFQLQEGGATIPSDIYSLGGLLFYLVTGVLPNGSSLSQICERHDPASQLPPPSMRAVRRDIDRDLEAICRRALSRRAQDRHQSASELANDLEAWLRREPIHWLRPSMTRRLWLVLRRRPWTVAIVTILLVGVTMASALGFYGQVIAQEERITRLLEASFEKRRQWEGRKLIENLFSKVDQIRALNAHRPRASSLVLMQGLLMQWALGPELEFVLDQPPAAWRDRIELGKAALEPRSGIARGSLEELMWESSLSFWLVSSEYEDEALELLKQNRSAWAAKLDPTDPWLRQLEALQACAEVRRELKRLEGGAPVDTGVMMQAEAVLRKERELFRPVSGVNGVPKFRGPTEGTGLHLLVLRTLYDLYSSSARPEPKLRDEVLVRLREYVSGKRLKAIVK